MYGQWRTDLCDVKFLTSFSDFLLNYLLICVVCVVITHMRIVWSLESMFLLSPSITTCCFADENAPLSSSSPEKVGL